MTVKKILHVRIDPRVLEQLKAKAKEENRSLSNLVETVLREYVR